MPHVEPGQRQRWRRRSTSFPSLVCRNASFLALAWVSLGLGFASLEGFG